MNNRTEKVLKALLSRCPEEQRKSLERFLPDHERLTLSELPFFEETTPEPSSNSKGTLENLHWSWLVPILQDCTVREQRLYLSALQPEMAEKIAASLQLARSHEDISEMARQFLKEHLLKILAGSDKQILPIDYLPSSSLNRLARLEKKQLIRLIDFLAMQDLSIEFRQIVETKILKKIYSFLTEEQKAVLQQINATSEANPFGKLGLDRWDGTPETLRTLLHRRGLARLGAALSGQDDDLIWIICHKLDIGRGGALLKLCAKEPTAGTTEISKRQVEELLDKLD